MPDIFFKLIKSSELLVIFLLVITAIFFRTIHFGQSFNFSSDQGAFSLTALEQWEEKKLALVGPPFSFHIGDRVIYQGPFIYYLQTFFLILGNWDPFYASLIFSVFSCLMIFPLYYGTKNLINQKTAILLCIIYALNPFYVLYTRFLWNPNFQFALLPVLIFLLGQYQKKAGAKYLLLAGVMSGLLLQLHYQLFIGIFFLLGYFRFYKSVSWLKLSLLVLGMLIAFLPVIYYEFIHRFFNLNNLYFFISHRDILYLQNKDQSSLAPHYYLSLSFIFILVILSFIRNKITLPINLLIGSVLLFLSVWFFVPISDGAYGMADNWNYQNEAKVHQIIKDQQLKNFNVVNLEYDSLYHVQKYLLKKDQVVIDQSNYYNNQYLFAVSKRPDLFSYPAYEIQSFQPSEIVNSWQINPTYKLYLLKRQTN